LTTIAKLANLVEHTFTAAAKTMSKISESRRVNIRALVDERGGITKLSRLLGYKNPSFLSQMLSNGGATREVTERTARRIEEALGLPAGHLDREPEAPLRAPVPDQQSAVPVRSAQSAPTTSDETVRLVADVIRAVGAACDESGVNLAPGKFAEVVALVYGDSVERGLRPDHVKQVVRLLR